MVAASGQQSGKGESLLGKEISACGLCPRLVNYCGTFRDITAKGSYWARPVPGYGDPEAELLIIGLAPGAQGANRTGRPFTGDAAGEVLYDALHRHGFCNQSVAKDRNDGLLLKNAYITNAVKCVPPGNRPAGDEKKTCLDWLERELDLLPRVRLVLAMGRDAFQSYLRLLKSADIIPSLNHVPFVHGKPYQIDGHRRTLLATYHFSRYNMNTGVLNPEMVEALFGQVTRLIRKK